MKSASKTTALVASPTSELLDAIRIEAALDADRVVIFLDGYCNEIRKHHLSSPLSDGWRTSVSPCFLLELAAALKILTWEKLGLVHYLGMDLPPARERLLRLLQTVGQFDPEPSLFRQRIKAFCDHFVWHAEQDIGASIALGAIKEDRLAECIAIFLWKHRHDLE